MKNKSWFALILASTTVVTVAGCQTTRWGYESAPYTVVQKDGAVEIRDYPELVWIETPDRDRSERGSQSFNKLFRFISGHNETGEKIPMTTPVYSTGQGEDRLMAFVLPAAISREDAPAPGDAEVQLATIPPARYGVMRYNGRWTDRREKDAILRIRLWAQENQYETTGDPVFGYFDPPWTPGFMRRNEVMLRLMDAKYPLISGSPHSLQ